MQDAEPGFTIEATEILVKIINSNYTKADLKQVANNKTHLNAEERTQLLILLEDSKYLFNGTLGYWDTDTIDLELTTGSKPFNSYILPGPQNLKKDL